MNFSYYKNFTCLFLLASVLSACSLNIKPPAPPYRSESASLNMSDKIADAKDKSLEQALFKVKNASDLATFFGNEEIYDNYPYYSYKSAKQTRSQSAKEMPGVLDQGQKSFLSNYFKTSLATRTMIISSEGKTLTAHSLADGKLLKKLDYPAEIFGLFLEGSNLSVLCLEPGKGFSIVTSQISDQELSEKLSATQVYGNILEISSENGKMKFISYDNSSLSSQRSTLYKLIGRGSERNWPKVFASPSHHSALSLFVYTELNLNNTASLPIRTYYLLPEDTRYSLQASGLAFQLSDKVNFLKDETELIKGAYLPCLEESSKNKILKISEASSDYLSQYQKYAEIGKYILETKEYLSSEKAEKCENAAFDIIERLPNESDSKQDYFFPFATDGFEILTDENYEFKSALSSEDGFKKGPFTLSSDGSTIKLSLSSAPEKSLSFGGKGSDSPALKEIGRLIISPKNDLLALPIVAKNNSAAIFANKDFEGYVIIALNKEDLMLRGLIETSISREKALLFNDDYFFTIKDQGLNLYSNKGLNLARSLILASR